MAMSPPHMARRSFASILSMSRPSNASVSAVTSALSGSRPMTDFIVTDLPEPDSPTTAMKSPSLTVRLTPRTALTSVWCEWNVVHRFSTRSSSLGAPFVVVPISPAPSRHS